MRVIYQGSTIVMFERFYYYSREFCATIPYPTIYKTNDADVFLWFNVPTVSLPLAKPNCRDFNELDKRNFRYLTES